VQGWGCRIVGRREDGRWYAESPDGRRCQRAWNDDGRPDLYPQNTLVARVADLSAWDPHGEDHFRANPEELATMLSSTVPSSESLALDLPGEADAEPAAEPAFVLYRYACLDAYGRLVQTFNPDEEGRQIAEAWRDLPENLGRARVAPLFLRREDATP